MNEAFVQISVRLLVGLICGAIGAFFGGLVIATVISGGETSDPIRMLTRIGSVALIAAAGSRLGWFGTVETRWQSVWLFVLCVLSGFLGSWIALLVAGTFFEHTDLYVLNRDISGAGFFGAIFACNIPSLVFSIVLARRGEI